MSSARGVIADIVVHRGCVPGDEADHIADAILRALDAAGYAVVPKKLAERCGNNNCNCPHGSEMKRAMVAAAGSGE